MMTLLEMLTLAAMLTGIIGCTATIGLVIRNDDVNRQRQLAETQRDIYKIEHTELRAQVRRRREEDGAHGRNTARRSSPKKGVRHV